MSKKDPELRESLLTRMAMCRALIRCGAPSQFWTAHYMDLAETHNRIFSSPKQKVSRVP